MIQSDWKSSRLVLGCLVISLSLVAACGGPEPPSDDSASTTDAETPEASAPAESSEPKVVEPLVLQPLPEGEADDGGFTIAQVMQIGHDSKLYRELYRDEPPVEVVERFQQLYGDLVKRTSPIGEAEDWEKRANALNDAVTAIAAGESDGVSKLKRAINCSSCHGRHRG